MVADAEGIPSFGDTHTNEQNGQAYSGFLLRRVREDWEQSFWWQPG